MCFNYGSDLLVELEKWGVTNDILPFMGSRKFALALLY